MSRRRCQTVLLLLTLTFSALPGSLLAGRRKSPSMAFGTALVPGAALHGLGHYYAGEKKTAGILLTLEIFGLGMMLAHKSPKDGGEGIAGRSLEDGMGVAGAALFFGSYLYDVMSAPQAAIRYNRRREANRKFTFQFEPPTPKRTDRLQPTFRFTSRF